MEFSTIKEIVEFGLGKNPEKQTIVVKLRDLMYINRVLEEYVRFFHQPMHYPKIEDIENFLGSVDSGGGFEVFSTAVYKKFNNIKLPKEIETMIDDRVFDHPSFPEYYQEKKE